MPRDPIAQGDSADSIADGAEGDHDQWNPLMSGGHGAHGQSTRHVITPELAAVLADARRRRGRSLREAARNVGVAPGTIVRLEKARRAPSAVVARNIVPRLPPDRGRGRRALR